LELVAVRLRRRPKLSADFNGGVRHAVAAELVLTLDPDGVMSALPVSFRDTVNEAHRQAQEALTAASFAQQRCEAIEERIEARGTADERLDALEAELARVTEAIGRRTGSAI
jgi:hypothetical protein